MFDVLALTCLDSSAQRRLHYSTARKAVEKGERKRERKKEPAFELVNQGEHETTKHTNQVASNTCATPREMPKCVQGDLYVSSPEFSIGDLVLLDGSERISLYPYIHIRCEHLRR